MLSRLGLMMKKQLIVVVHGVGVRDAGISTDLLATALDDDPPLLQGEAGTVAPVAGSHQPLIWRPHSSDDFHLVALFDIELWCKPCLFFFV